MLTNVQNGFRPNRSCLDHIFTLYDLVDIRRVKKMETFCALLDFQKAFNFVNHDFMLHTLLHIGIDGKTYNMVKTIYTQSVSCVLVDDRMLDWFPVESGVRQVTLSHPSSSQSL